MNSTVISSFQKMIDVNTPIIYIHDYDFIRIDELIRQVVAGKKVFEWNPATGTTDFITRLPRGFGENRHWKISFKKSTMRKKPKKNI